MDAIVHAESMTAQASMTASLVVAIVVFACGLVSIVAEFVRPVISFGATSLSAVSPDNYFQGGTAYAGA